ncbi:hypothetical protein KFK09_006514 [Dendrobium nobile]|uniref:Uncharacterized protein n=1 Tax=Dendrobium nobile TaxID=94219 RepID=A0A8T3BUP7_DENNO|nr:hypothetical protein KFK09_006514 [Dendrobium nobile]
MSRSRKGSKFHSASPSQFPSPVARSLTRVAPFFRPAPSRRISSPAPRPTAVCYLTSIALPMPAQPPSAPSYPAHRAATGYRFPFFPRGCKSITDEMLNHLKYQTGHRRAGPPWTKQGLFQAGSSVRTGFSTGRTEEICEEICHFRLYEPGAVGTIRLYREKRQEREREGKRRGSLVLEPVERFSSDDAVRRFVYLAVRAREQEIGIDPDLQILGHHRAIAPSGTHWVPPLLIAIANIMC